MCYQLACPDQKGNIAAAAFEQPPMAEGGSGFKAVLVLIVAVILIAAAFGFFNVAYPAGPPPGKPSSGRYQLFSYQLNDTTGLGKNATSFSPSAASLVTVQGYVQNISSGFYLTSVKIYVAMFPVETITTTDGGGFYQYSIKYTGKGQFAYKTAGYKTLIVPIDARTSVFWANVSLAPAQGYAVTGSVVDTYGNHVAGAKIIFSGYYGSEQRTSNATGGISAWLYNDTYLYQIYGPEYKPVSGNLTVAGHAVSGLNVVLSPNVPAPFTLSGYAINPAGLPVQNATVSTYPVVNSTRTNATGHYLFRYMYGSIALRVNATGYLNGSLLHLLVNRSVAVANFTLVPVQSIGQGFMLYNLQAGGQTGDPAVNATSLLSAISSTAATGPLDESPVSLTVSLSAGGAALSNLPYIAYVNSDGIIYRGLFTTGSAGNAHLSLNYSGSYTLATLTLFDGFYHTGGLFTGSMSMAGSLSPSPLHDLSVEAVNVVDNFTIPPTGVSVSNSLFQITGTVTPVLNATYFNYTLPDGEYSFAYSSQGYLNATVNTSITGSGTNTTLALYPYLISLVNNSNMTWNVSLTSAAGTVSSALAVNRSTTFHASRGIYYMNGSALNGGYLEKSNVSVTPTWPVQMVYLNRTYAYEQSYDPNYTFTPTTGNLGTLNNTFNINGTSHPEILVDGVQLVNLTFAPTNSTVVFPGYSFTFAGNSTLFPLPYAVAGSGFTLLFSSTSLNATEAAELLTIRMDYSFVSIAVQGLKYS